MIWLNIFGGLIIYILLLGVGIGYLRHQSRINDNRTLNNTGNRRQRRR
ncbi:hypothetical protein SAMN05661012_00355 [Chitinophaga sancti]|uniref:Uncharacterized protein n=1 Tax=Chitinophaga sancti TaxID=1004 RepID=A0A1K1M0L4_9BACT|nr:hypothetical protein SAMN05661012_00355 [Chitinophaga sancti]